MVWVFRSQIVKQGRRLPACGQDLPGPGSTCKTTPLPLEPAILQLSIPDEYVSGLRTVRVPSHQQMPRMERRQGEGQSNIAIIATYTNPPITAQPGLVPANRSLCHTELSSARATQTQHRQHQMDARPRLIAYNPLYARRVPPPFPAPASRPVKRALRAGSCPAELVPPSLVS